MKPVERFFRKYFLSMMGIIALFLLLNVVLSFSVLIWAWQSSDTSKVSISKISESITTDEDGNVKSITGLPEMLKENHAWAMLLDDKGTVIWQELLPDELPKQYTSLDIAKFSRWYLQDYPVYVLEHPEGLLVIGVEKNSLVKYHFSLNEDYIRKMTAGIVAVFIINIVVVVLLIWKNTHHVEKAITPILKGIEAVSSGQTVLLPEKGELAEINKKLNKAGAFIVKKDRARAEWISGISHDVRTPLSVILGFAGQMEDDESLPAAAREKAAYIRRQGEKLRGLISDLNLTSKLEYSMQPLRVDEVFIVEMARQVVCEFLDSGLEDQYSIEFASDPQSEMEFILGDEALLKRALANLIQNSIHHNPEGCAISVSVLCSESNIKIVVADNGVGLSDEKLKELKEKPHYIKSTEDRLNLRYGLGLVLVRQIVEAHSGEIRLQSGNQKGLCVELVFHKTGI